MLIKIVPPLSRSELCSITFGKCILWVCLGCWGRNKKITICPVPNNEKSCKYVKPVKDKKHGLPGNCNCKKFLLLESELITAIQLLGYAK